MSKPSTLGNATAERRIEQALMALGMSFADASGIVQYDPEAETSYWAFDPITERESIHVGPMIAQLEVGAIEMALRHEFLHRSMFHGFGERYARRELANLTLDVCINRLLFEAYPDKMRKASQAIYPAESKKTAIALADCTADVSHLPTQLATLWTGIWSRLPDGSYPTVNPASLYFRLVRLSDSDVSTGEWLQKGTGCSFTRSKGPCAGHGELRRRPSKRVDHAISSVASDIGRRLPKGSALGTALDDYNVTPASIGTSKVEQFLKKIQVRRIAAQAAAKITEPWRSGSRIQPYPTYPTRLGLVYAICGITNATHMYWNREVENIGARMSIGLYMDVSGSMIGKFPIVSAFVDALRDFPLRLKTFDTVVREAEVSALAAGKIKGGGGTDFDAPLNDLLADEQIEAAVLFTDGEASVSELVGVRLRSSRKRLYVVYLLDGPSAPSSSLDRWATEAMTFRVS
ncbi:MAG: hypothetical protein U0165_05680 [Polyangiaceae bacterium]